MKGIDVSKHNGNINWTAVHTDFVIIRAGYGKAISQKDPYFEQNYRGAKAANIPVGTYWFSYALSPSEAEVEAKVFLEVIKGKQFEYPVFLDVEYQKALDKGKKTISAIIKAFCTVLENAGYWCGVYISRGPAQTLLDEECRTKYSLWLAEWASKLNYSGPVSMWQYSETGKVAGVTGNVDLDECYVDFPIAIKTAGKNGFEKPNDSRLLPYISDMTASECQVYLNWCANKGACNYQDTLEDFKRFLQDEYDNRFQAR